MSERVQREWRFYLDDMIGFAEKVIAYTDGLDQEEFVASGLNYDATIRNLELIGEAATRIPETVRAAYPELPWRLIVATRNRLIHGSGHRQRYAAEHPTSATIHRFYCKPFGVFSTAWQSDRGFVRRIELISTRFK